MSIPCRDGNHENSLGACSSRKVFLIWTNINIFAIPSPIPILQFPIPIPLLRISRFRYNGKIIKPYFRENFHFSRYVSLKSNVECFYVNYCPSRDIISRFVTLFRTFLISTFKIFRDSYSDFISKIFAIPIPLKISRFNRFQNRFRSHVTGQSIPTRTSSSSNLETSI